MTEKKYKIIAPMYALVAMAYFLPIPIPIEPTELDKKIEDVEKKDEQEL